jgi:hypothetical protein
MAPLLSISSEKTLSTGGDIMKRNGRVSISRLLVIIAFLLFCAPSLIYADEPRAVAWKVVTAGGSGTLEVGAKAQATIELFAIKEFSNLNLLVAFPGCGEDPPTSGKPIGNLSAIIKGESSSPINIRWTDPGPQWRMCPDREALLLKAGARSRMIVTVEFLRVLTTGISPFLRAQVYEISEKELAQTTDPRVLLRMIDKRQAMSTFFIDLFYKLSAKEATWYLGSYAKVFGSPLPGEQTGKSTADYELLRTRIPVDLLSFRRNLPLPGLFIDDKGEMFRQTLYDIKQAGSGQAGAQVCTNEPFDGGGLLKTRLTETYSHQLSGIFSTKWSADHSLHPGFGFRVEAWTNENTGAWRMLASDWVQSDGTWQLGVPSSLGYQGKQLRIFYRSYNSYYKPQGQTGSSYSWADPEQTNITTPFYAGHRYADTDGGAYTGVGELVESAMYMWSRLYWTAGINPVPATPLNFYFPNTWDDCGDGSGVPWSCADASGNIWLTAAHGTRAEVVNHEMAHQLNNKFWDGRKPAGSGGSHSSSSCYSGRLGMTLREGFAEFTAAWVGYPTRDIAEGGFGSGRWALGYDPEQRLAPPSCSNGWENELWVARTFWDLHDTRSDGDDILWFVHRGAVLALFLGNGVAHDGDARDMRYYESIYRAAASPGHQGFISDIFNQNRM